MRYQLATSTQLDGTTRQLAFLWNAWLRERVLWRDADVGTACREFYLGHPEIWRDSPLRRAFVGHLLLLHQFRLLTPEQMDEVLAAPAAVKGKDKPVELIQQAAPPANGGGRGVNSKEAAAVAAAEEGAEDAPLREEQAVDSKKPAKLDPHKAAPMGLEQATEQLELELTMPADSEQADSELAAPMDSEQSVPLATEQALPADSEQAAPADGKKLAQPAAGDDREPGPGQPEPGQGTRETEEPRASGKALEPQASLWKKHRKTLKPLSPVAEAPRPPAA